MKNAMPLSYAINHLPTFGEVKQMSEADKDCIEEIRNILMKHKNLDRFGITLLHKHFELEDDEMLIENVDEKTRTQTIRPIRKKGRYSARCGNNRNNVESQGR